MIIRSMKGRLFSVLVAATGLIWLCASIWIFFQTRSEVEHVLDTRLQEAARMVSSLASSGASLPSAGVVPDLATGLKNSGYERQLSCQIWSLDGRLVARSSGAPTDRIGGEADGFSDQQVGGETWRVYAVSETSKGIRVLVGDRLGLRERLISDLLRGLLWPALLIVPLLGLMTWTILGRGLRPLQKMATDLANRDVDDLSALDVRHTPPELVPLANALNSLFSRVGAAREHEREITAFAAHELRTPLAGLKIQAEVALAAGDARSRDIALRNIMLSVDRTSRLVRQLLAVARLDTQSHVDRSDQINLGEMLEQIVSEGPMVDAVGFSVSAALYDIRFSTNRELLIMALRNLHENAVHHASSRGRVNWSAKLEPALVTIVVEDDGPGIPEAEMVLVRSRFFRGRHKSSSGSGLGLSIVELALNKIGASLILENRTGDAGLRAIISLPYRKGS